MKMYHFASHVASSFNKGRGGAYNQKGRGEQNDIFIQTCIGLNKIGKNCNLKSDDIQCICIGETEDIRRSLLDPCTYSEMI